MYNLNTPAEGRYRATGWEAVAIVLYVDQMFVTVTYLIAHFCRNPTRSWSVRG